MKGKGKMNPISKILKDIKAKHPYNKQSYVDSQYNKGWCDAIEQVRKELKNTWLWQFAEHSITFDLSKANTSNIVGTRNVKPLISEALIDEYEKLKMYKFCDSFRKFVIHNNGGTPVKNTFNVNVTRQCKIDVLMDFNNDDAMDDDSVWSVYAHYDLPDIYVPFAFETYNNLICFNKDNEIVLVDPDTLQTEKIADNFDEFLKCLYQNHHKIRIMQFDDDTHYYAYIGNMEVKNAIG